MKRRFTSVILFVVLLVVGASVYAKESFDLPDVDDKYIGTYIPVDIEEEIKKTKNLDDALYKLGYPIHHDVLYLGKNRCNSDYHFNDTYAISCDVFLQYRFEITSEGTFLYDDKGYKYRQISNFVNEYGYGYSEFMGYVSNLIIDNTYSLKNVKISGDFLELDGENYSIIGDTTFFEQKKVKFWLFSSSMGYCALVKNGINGELYKGKKNGKYWTYTEELIAEYPFMFLDTADLLPYYDDLSKDQYRLLRNLVYARHGYNFKSEDLRKVFNQFTWYKQDPNFSESMLTDAEKQYVNELLKKEAELSSK